MRFQVRSPHSASNRLELWQERFDAFANSQCTVDQFCRQQGFTTATFYYWKKKVNAAREHSSESNRTGTEAGVTVNGSDSTPPTFLPVHVERTIATSSEVVICLPSGVQVRLPTDALDSIAVVLKQVQSLASVEAA